MRFGGIGAIYALPSGANPTPIPFAIAKSASVSGKRALKGLNGQWGTAIDVFSGPEDYQIKLTNADFKLSALQMVSGGTLTTASGILIAAGEVATIPATPYQVTVSNSAQFSEDGGVLDLTAAKWLTRVASAPATGQYSVSAGVYTFAAADTTHSLTINYLYTSTTPSNLAVSNRVMGPSTGYLVRIFQNFTVNGVTKAAGFKFYNVHFSDWSVEFKSEDWSEPSLSGMAIQDVTTTKIYDAFGD